METTEAAQRQTAVSTRYTYKAIQFWAGWWGGFGSNGSINAQVNEVAADGWRLIDSRSSIRLWFWFIPRPKLLLFFEK